MLEAITGVWNSTAILTAINVFILFFVASYFGSPMVARVFKKRQAAITEERESTRTSMEEAEKLRLEYEAKLKAVDEETERIVAEAKETARHREEVSLGNAKNEADRILEHARTEGDLEKKRVNDEIKQEIINASSAAAESILARNLDKKKQDDLIDDTLNGMGDGVWQS
jgi:F-type H+-transporting ATPase subunit b